MSDHRTACDSGRIELFLEQKVSDGEQAAFESHLTSYADCRQRLEATAATEEIWTGVRQFLRDRRLPQDDLGPSNSDATGEEGSLALAEILRVGMQAAAGLAAAHAQGLVHRDVKPANILLADGIERVKLTDFGLARAADDASLTKTGVIAGTPQYMSPEQARGEAIDQRSDLFSPGSVLYAMCAGRAPFRAETSYGMLRRVTDEEPRPIREINPEIPDWLCEIVAKLMAKQPEDRFQSAAEVAKLLKECLAHVQQPTVVPLPVSLAKAAFCRRRPWFTLAIATLGVFLMGLLGMLLAKATDSPDISGRWQGEGWGQLTLKQIRPGEYTGTYTDTVNKEKEPGTIELKWSRIERRFNGAWREGDDDRFGDLSIRLVDNEIRGALTTDAQSKINPATPRLADFACTRSDEATAAMPRRVSTAAGTSAVQPGVTTKPFGTVRGERVDLYTLTNATGMKVSITNYGGIVVSVIVRDRGGKYDDVALGYDSVDDYVKDRAYLGALIGRYGNRIAKGKFHVEGKVYTLAQNDHGNHLNGGKQGFDKVIWIAKVPNPSRPMLELSYFSKDGEEGYPGNLAVTVTYGLMNSGCLSIHYEAKTDKATPVNLTNHTYFNLAGAGSGDVLGHELWFDAERFTPVGKDLIPTGEMRLVQNTPFDFRSPTAIGQRINQEDEQLKYGLGYDQDFVLRESNNPSRLAARVYEPKSGRVLKVYTTEPGIHFSSGNFPDDSIVGKGRKVYEHRSGFCLDAQHFPDSPNKPGFPSTILAPGRAYSTTTIYQFSTLAAPVEKKKLHATPQ
jgi:galactose mutarotase-like enzyme